MQLIKKDRWGLLIISLCFMTFCCLPVMVLYGSAIFQVKVFLKAIIQSFDGQSHLLNSFGLSISVALISTFLGSTMGLFLGRFDLPGKQWLKFGLLLPLFVSPYYVAVAVRDFAMLVYGTSVQMDSIVAVGIVEILCFTPLAIFIISGAVTNIDSKLEESALLFTKEWKVFKGIIIPLLKPAFVTSFVLIFIFSIAEVTVASYFVVNLQITEVFLQFSAYYNHTAAAANGLILVLVCLALLFIDIKYLKDASFFVLGKRGSNSKLSKTKKLKWPLTLGLYLYLALTTLTLLYLLLDKAIEGQPPEYLVNKRFSGGTIMSSNADWGYSIDYLVQAWNLLAPSLLSSIGIASVGAVLITFFSLVFGFISERLKIKMMDYLLLFLFALPATIYGIALIKFYNRPILDVIYGSSLIVLIGYTGRFTFVGTRIIANGLKKIPQTFEEVAKIVGGSKSAIALKIVLPLIIPELLVTFLLSFLLCFTEMATTIVIYPPGTSVLPVKIATAMHNTPDGLISAMVLIAISITWILVGTLFYSGKYFLKISGTFDHAH